MRLNEFTTKEQQAEIKLLEGPIGKTIGKYAGGALGALAGGAALGATPVLGPIAGGIAGAVGGAYGGSQLGKAIGDRAGDATANLWSKVKQKVGSLFGKGKQGQDVSIRQLKKDVAAWMKKHNLSDVSAKELKNASDLSYNKGPNPFARETAKRHMLASLNGNSFNTPMSGDVLNKFIEDFIISVSTVSRFDPQTVTGLVANDPAINQAFWNWYNNLKSYVLYNSATGAKVSVHNSRALANDAALKYHKSGHNAAIKVIPRENPPPPRVAQAEFMKRYAKRTASPQPPAPPP